MNDRKAEAAYHPDQPPRENTMTKRYRKKPVTIEAVGPLTPENRDEIAAWCHGKAEERYLAGPGRGMTQGVLIHTLEGDMAAAYGDYIIKGVAGEFYPCKPSVFAESYEDDKE